MKDLLTITLFMLAFVVIYMWATSKFTITISETMAPLNFGTYENNYPRGDCKKGSFERTECSVGNCPLGTTITDERFCGIQCAQDPDPASRKDCYDYCINMMKDGCH